MKDQRFLIMMSASVTLHLLVGLGVLFLMRVSPVMKDGPEKATEIELVMEEHKGDLRPAGGPPPAETSDPSKDSQAKARDRKPEEAERRSPTDPMIDAREDRPVDTREQAKETIASDAPAAAERSRPTPPAPQPAPVISLSGTDSPSHSLAFGDHIIPASPDAVFHNRPPVYPDEAALAGEHGVVMLVIHVAPSGQVAGADVLRSSGFVRLDHAALAAVMHWRFLPAVKGGQPVASDMRMQFDFQTN
jgi:periplasmic protein TonB